MFTFWAGQVHFNERPRLHIDMQFQDTSVRIEPHHIFSGAHCSYWRFNCTVRDGHFIYIAYQGGFEHTVILRPSLPDGLYRRTRSPRCSNDNKHALNCDLIWALDLCLQRNQSGPLIAVESGTEAIYRDIVLNPSCLATRYTAHGTHTIIDCEPLLIYHRHLPDSAIPRVDSELVST
jgi:hypothetical protein